MLETSSAKITGKPGSSGWSQVHDFIPDDAEKLTARGQLFVAIATSRGELGEIDTISAGRELIARIHEEYFGDLTLKPFNALRHSIEKVTKEFRESWGDVEMAACSFVGDIVYSVATGGAEVAISRGGILGTILKSTDSSVIEASGFPKKGDVILLATKVFYQKVPQGVIKAAISAETPDQIVENFGPDARSGEGLGSLAVVVVKFDEKQEISNFATNIPTPLPITVKSTTDSVGKITSSLKGIFKKLTGRIPTRNIYIKSEIEDEVVSQNKKLTFSIALILLVILFVSVGFGIMQKKSRDLKNKYQSMLSSAFKEVDEAISLASISPDKSREIFINSEDKLHQIEALNIKDPEITKLKNKIDESRAAILGEYTSNPQLFLDLSLLSSGFKGDVVSVSGENVFILDKVGKRVISVVLSTKKSKVVAGPNIIDEALDLASYEDRVFVLQGDGVYEVSGSKTKVIEKTWSGDALIRGFAGNLYVMDKAGNAIYRYAGQGKTFGSQQNWLAAGTNADFSQVRQWVIDGSVYALLPYSKILKFSLGSPQSFSIKSVVPEIGTIDAVYASEDNDGVYFLDKAGKRVVVTDKKGAYKAQYMADITSQATNLVVSEENKKIIIVVSDKLYTFDIKHI